MTQFPIASGPHTDLDYQWQHRVRPQLESSGWTVVRAAGGYVALDPTGETAVLVHGLHDRRRDFWSSISLEGATLLFENGSVRFDTPSGLRSGAQDAAASRSASDFPRWVLQSDPVPTEAEAQEQPPRASRSGGREVETFARRPGRVDELAAGPYRDALRGLTKDARVVERYAASVDARVVVRTVLYVSGIMVVVRSDDHGPVIVGHMTVVERLRQVAEERHLELDPPLEAPRPIDRSLFADPREWQRPAVAVDPVDTQFQDIVRHLLYPDSPPAAEPPRPVIERVRRGVTRVPLAWVFAPAFVSLAMVLVRH